MRRLLCALGWHHYGLWRVHEPPCIAGENIDHYVRQCRRRGCDGGSFFRRHRLKERA